MQRDPRRPRHAYRYSTYPPCIAVICSTHLLPLRNPPNLQPSPDDCRDSLTRHPRCQQPAMIDQEKTIPHRKTRVVSVVAATAIALACGTNVCLCLAITTPVLTRRSMHTQLGHRSSPTSSSSPRHRAMLSYGDSSSYIKHRNSRILGHGSEHGHVCLGHTSRSHNGQGEPSPLSHHRHVLSLPWILSHQNGYVTPTNAAPGLADPPQPTTAAQGPCPSA